MGEINVVPYIDVMLVLLIIFMVTAPLLNKGVEVDLPGAAAEALEDGGRDAEPIVLTITRAGELYLNVAPSATVALAPLDVVNFANQELTANPLRQVLVKADQRVEYGEVVGGMVLLQKAGAQKVGFVTDPSTADES
ncbi:MAG: protein TolR [Gammaproteobacteria bacterium]